MNRPSILEEFFEAHKVVFGPIIFSCVVCAKRSGLLSAVDEAVEPCSAKELALKTNLSLYAVQILTDVLQAAKILRVETNEAYSLTRVGLLLLHDELTGVNLDFVADVCLPGLEHLKDSLQEGKPCGLKCFGELKTIYDGFDLLPNHVKTSWYKFDHFHSKVAHTEAAQIVSSLKPKIVFDIGGNTGEFSKLLLKTNPEIQVTLFDLPAVIEKAKINLAPFANRACTCAVDWLANDVPAVQQKADIVWMSQFLSCFSEDVTCSVLDRVQTLLTKEGRILILDCVNDFQEYDAARLSVAATSVYFANMANGRSRFRSDGEMRRLFQKSGLKVTEVHHHLGISHSLYICERN